MLDRAIVYDLETYPNVFLLGTCSFARPSDLHIFEISEWQNDLGAMLEWLRFLRDREIHMLGFNNVHFDYPLVDFILRNPEAVSPAVLAKMATEIIRGEHDPIWKNDRLIPQIDLYKVNHFDNKARSTSLKALEFAMRSDTIEDLPITPGTMLTREQRDELRAYNAHDITETHKFATYCRSAIDFRVQQAKKLRGDVLNWNDTKIGEQTLIQRIGRDVCYNEDRSPRQTIRTSLPLSDVIFPYVRFDDPGLQRVQSYLAEQVLTDTTKGVFNGLDATIAGVTLHFGTGGIHGSVERSAYVSDDTHVILDADVASLYPSIAIVNRLYPEHLGQIFVDEYAALKEERFKHAKGTAENAALKLALNGTYGKSNSIYSPFYDPKFTMQITINGQLLLAMLVEWLVGRVPDLELIQINTDGITVRIPRRHQALYERVCSEWQKFTRLDLEFTDYSHMWIRDVNNYIAEMGDDSLKLKGCYWYPETFPDDVKSAWHRDLGGMIIPMAAVFQIVHGIPIEDTVWSCFDPHLFTLRARATRGAHIEIDGERYGRIVRYVVSTEGGHMTKVSPPVAGSRSGAFKKANGVSWADYARHPDDVHNPEIHTKNKSVYETRRTSIASGYRVQECNNIKKFDFSTVNRDFYIDEAKKISYITNRDGEVA